ncbi:hypothetical protein V8C86DRAFT_2522077 [Haematococcus lacustris]
MARQPDIADLVEPVPAGILPLGLRKNAGAVELFKQEFRAAQRLRSTEGIFIPEVVRTTHPPEQGPHGVASHPAPSYVLPPGIQRPAARNHLTAFVGQGGPSSALRDKSPARGRKGEWAEQALNTPNQDYLLARQLRPDSQMARPSPPPPAPAVPSPGSPGARPTSALIASMQARMAASSRPMTANALSPPMAGAVGLALGAKERAAVAVAAGANTGAAVELVTQRMAGAWSRSGNGKGAPV